jgi:hypothetical protein
MNAQKVKILLGKTIIVNLNVIQIMLMKNTFILLQLEQIIIYINVPNYAIKLVIITMVIIQVNVSKVVLGIFNIHQKMKKSAIVIAYNLQLINLLSIKDALIYAAIQKNFIMKAIRYVYLDAIMEIMHTPKMKITHLNV